MRRLILAATASVLALAAGAVHAQSGVTVQQLNAYPGALDANAVFWGGEGTGALAHTYKLTTPQIDAYIQSTAKTWIAPANFTGGLAINANAMTFPSSAATLNYKSGSYVVGHCPTIASTDGAIGDAGAACGTGAGSVTSVSVTTANGISGTVATATTTPAITLALGAITPSSVAVGGASIGSNVLAVTGSAAISGAVTAGSVTAGSVTTSAAGSATTPIMTLDGDAFGFYRNATNQWTYAGGGSAAWSFVTTVGARMASGYWLGWTGTDSLATADTLLCRQGAGVVEIAAGSACGNGGSLQLGSLTTTSGGVLVPSGQGFGTISTGMTVNDGGGANGLVQFIHNLSATGASVSVGSFSSYTGSTSITTTALAIQPTINQSGTAAYTGLLINPTETATGSGAKRLISAQVGGVDKFVVGNDGSSSQVGAATAASFFTSSAGSFLWTSRGYLSSAADNSFTYNNNSSSNSVTFTLSGTHALAVNGNFSASTGAFSVPGIGVTSTDGLVVQNLTAAAVGAQQFSPRLRLTGQGWKTTATAASQSTDIIFENQPAQGSTSPIPHLDIGYTTNGGSVLNLGEIYDGGAGVGTVYVIGNNGGASQIFFSSFAGGAATASIGNSGSQMQWQGNRALLIQTNLNGTTSPTINLATATTSGAGVSGGNINLTPGNGTGTGASNGGSVVVTPGSSTNGAAGLFSVVGASSFTGNMTASGLLTSGTIANAICSDSSGHLVAMSAANCFAGGGSAGGSTTQVQYNSSGSLAGVAGWTFDGVSKTTLGVSGASVGAVVFNNASTGSITLQPVTGALGTVTVSIPAITDTLVTLTATQTLTNKTLTSPVMTTPTLGTVGSGTWQATVIAGQYGGTGVANTGKTLTLGANFVTTGAGVPTLAFGSGTATYTFPGATDTVDMLGTAQTFTAVKTFTNSDLKLLGSSTGATTFTSANAGASNFTWTVPAISDTFAGLTAANQSLSGGVTLTTFAIGTLSSGTTTLNCGNGPAQSFTNNGSFILAAPSSDGECMLMDTNGASAGAITFSGFSVPTSTGDPLTTTNTQKFTLSIWRINGTSGYRVAAMQ